MSIWETLQMEQRILEILDVQPEDPDHHFGRPFLTPYQIAIEFEHRFPDAFQQINKRVGGEGTGERDSLAQYIANELGRRIGRGQILTVEGVFLHHRRLHRLQYRDGNRIVEAKRGSDLSAYRRTD